MHHRNRVYRIGLVAVAALTVVALAGAGFAQATPRHGGTLVVSVTRQPTHLDPLLAINNSEYMLAALMYSGLDRLGPNMQPLPDLAASWTHNADLTQWTFDLRHGALFANGQEVTAADVVATFDAILNPKTGSPGRKNVGPITKVEALGKYQVRFTTSASDANLPVSLTYVNAKIVPKSVLDGNMKKLETTDYGSGPYLLKSFTPGQSAVLVRNPHYFIQGLPYLSEIKQVVYPDPTSEVTAFLNGQIDLMPELPVPNIGQVSAAKGVTVMHIKSGRYVDVVMRTTAKPFNDVRVRRALQLSIDRKALVDILLNGYGQVAYDTPISPAYRYYDKSLPVIHQNILQARKLLAEAGYPHGVDVTLYAANKPEIRTQLGVAIKAMARPAGFNIHVKTIPYSTYLSQVWRKAPFYIGYYNMQATENGIFQLTFTSSSAWNESQWNNKTFDGYVHQALVTANPAKRAKLYADAEVLMQKDAPVIIPVFLDLIAAEHDYVHGFQLTPTGNVFNLGRVWLGANAPSHN